MYYILYNIYIYLKKYIVYVLLYIEYYLLFIIYTCYVSYICVYTHTYIYMYTWHGSQQCFGLFLWPCHDCKLVQGKLRRKLQQLKIDFCVMCESWTFGRVLRQRPRGVVYMVSSHSKIRESGSLMGPSTFHPSILPACPSPDVHCVMFSHGWPCRRIAFSCAANSVLLCMTSLSDVSLMHAVMGLSPSILQPLFSL